MLRDWNDPHIWNRRRDPRRCVGNGGNSPHVIWVSAPRFRRFDIQGRNNGRHALDLF
jgi:hypothetical protein